MLKLRFAAPLSVLLALLLLAGCGGGDETTVVTVSKAEAIKRGDAVCVKSQKKTPQKAVAYIKTHKSTIKSKKGQEELVVAVLVPLLREELTAFEQVEPSSEAAEYEAIVDALEAGIEQIEADPPSFRLKKDNPLEEANELATVYGFKVCKSFRF